MQWKSDPPYPLAEIKLNKINANSKLTPIGQQEHFASKQLLIDPNAEPNQTPTPTNKPTQQTNQPN